MYILLLLLLFSPSVQAEVTIEQLCKEVTEEVLIAIEEGLIDKQAGQEILDGCGDIKLRDAYQRLSPLVLFDVLTNAFSF